MIRLLRRCVLGLALAMPVLAAAPAAAKFTVCNKTTHPLMIAIGWHAKRGWVSEGCLGRRQLARRAARHAEQPFERCRDLRPALRMARYDDGEQSRKLRGQIAMRERGELLFALMRRCP